MNPIERWLVWVAGAGTTITGLVYLWMKYLLVPPSPFAVVNHPLQPYMLKAHILVAPVLVFALGMIAVRHVWQSFRQGQRRARRTGLTTALTVIPMILSGYFIQAVTAAPLLKLLAWAHILTGAGFSVGLVLHQLVVRRSPLSSRAAAADVRGRESGGVETSRPR